MHIGTEAQSSSELVLLSIIVPNSVRSDPRRIPRNRILPRQPGEATGGCRNPPHSERSSCPAIGR